MEANTQNTYSTYIKTILFIALLIVSGSVLVGQKTYLIKIKALKDTFSINVKDTIEFQKQLEEKINEFYADGFINSNLDSLNKNSDTITGIIYKGEKHFWDTLIIKNENKLKQNIPVYSAKKQKPVNLLRLKKYKKEILRTLEDNGYPFARLNTEFYIHNKNLKLIIEVIPDDYYSYDTLVYNDIKISNSFLWRYLDIQPGAPYNESSLSKISGRIEQLSFLELTAAPLISYNNKKVRTDLSLKKINANYFDGLLGIVPDQDRDNKYMLTGELELSLLNTLGYGEQLDLQWKKNEQLSQQLNATIKWPYLFKSPLGVNGKVEMLKEDTSFVHLTLRGGLFIYFSGINSATAYYKNKQTIVLSPEDTSNILATNSYGSGLEVIWQNTDSKLNPSTGYMISTDFGAGRRIVNDPENSSDRIKSNYFEGKLLLQGILPVYKRWSVLVQNNLEGLYSEKKIYKSELLRIGGLRTLRGFDENAFFSKSHNISTIEIRWLFEQLSHFKVFADAGWINARTGGDRALIRALGFGTGINLHTNAGIFSISYALGRFNSEPIKLNNAKIHFGYINKF